jgi:hypothetical protein
VSGGASFGPGCEPTASAAQEGVFAKPHPSRDKSEAWFCDRGAFWGTYRQLCLCAKCGNSDHKRPDEPRHYAGVGQPWLHMLCDECFDSLPSDSDRSAEVGETEEAA